MTVVQAIRAQLIASSAVTALVSTRIFPQYIPQGQPVPAVVLTLISEVPVNSFDGSAETRLRQARIQVDAYAKGYLEAHAIASAADLVIANLAAHDLSAYRETTQDLYEVETQLHRVSSDYFVAL